MLLDICYLISDVFYLKLAITCKNLFFSLVVVRLVIFEIWTSLFVCDRVEFQLARWQKSCQEALNSQANFLNKYHALLLPFLYMTKNHTLLSHFHIRVMQFCRISCPGQKFCVGNFVPKEEISCPGKKFVVTERNSLSQEEISCQMKEFPVQDEISCVMKKFPMTGQHFKSQKEIPCHRRKSSVTGWQFLSHDKISCHRKKSATGRNLLSKEVISCHRKIFAVEGINSILKNKI